MQLYTLHYHTYLYNYALYPTCSSPYGSLCTLSNMLSPYVSYRGAVLWALILLLAGLSLSYLSLALSYTFSEGFAHLSCASYLVAYPFQTGPSLTQNTSHLPRVSYPVAYPFQADLSLSVTPVSSQLPRSSLLSEQVPDHKHSLSITPVSSQLPRSSPFRAGP